MYSGTGYFSRNDMLAAHRITPQQIGIIPQNNGGFGDVGKVSDIFFSHEIERIMQCMLEINEWAGGQVLWFRHYVAQGGEVQ